MINNVVNMEMIKQINRTDCLKFEEFDLTHEVDTIGPRKVSTDGRDEIRPWCIDNSDIVPDSQGYQPTPLYWIDMANKYLNESSNMSEYCFIDIGSGKGKVILYNLYKKEKYKKYIGIEADSSLHKISIDNMKSTSISVNRDVDFVNMSALDYDFSLEKTVYFMFYPFSKSSFDKFIKKNRSIMFNDNYIVFVFEQDYEAAEILGTEPVFANNAVTIYKLDKK